MISILNLKYLYRAFISNNKRLTRNKNSNFLLKIIWCWHLTTKVRPVRNSRIGLPRRVPHHSQTSIAFLNLWELVVDNPDSKRRTLFQIKTAARMMPNKNLKKVYKNWASTSIHNMRETTGSPINLKIMQMSWTSKITFIGTLFSCLRLFCGRL